MQLDLDLISSWINVDVPVLDLAMLKVYRLYDIEDGFLESSSTAMIYNLWKLLPDNMQGLVSVLFRLRRRKYFTNVMNNLTWYQS